MDVKKYTPKLCIRKRRIDLLTFTAGSQIIGTFWVQIPTECLGVI